MLFNFYEFILFFLPITVVGFFWIGRRIDRGAAIIWLVCASLFYYGWWELRYLGLIIFSIVFNFSAGRGLIAVASGGKQARKTLLVVGIMVNLGLLCYFKYAGFFISNVNEALARSLSIVAIVLPLAISFFTFKQISYLGDVAEQGEGLS